MIRIIVILVLLSFHGISVSAGNISGAFLKIGVGARPIGMGNTFIAVADDINAIAWNPAGLSQLKMKELGAMHAELFADTKYDFIGYAQPLANNSGTIGMGIQYLSQSTIDGRDANRKAANGFSGDDLALNIAYARNLSALVLLGANFKYLKSDIETESAHGIALDLGGMYRTNVPGLVFGVAVRNLGSDIKFINEKNSLPLIISGGAGYQLNSGLPLAADIKIISMKVRLF